MITTYNNSYRPPAFTESPFSRRRHGDALKSMNNEQPTMNKIMQNKPNFKNARMNITSFTTMNYEKITMNSAVKNKPKTNPNKPNFTPPTCASEDGYQRIKKEYKKSVIIRVNPWLLFYCKTNPIKPEVLNVFLSVVLSLPKGLSKGNFTRSPSDRQNLCTPLSCEIPSIFHCRSRTEGIRTMRYETQDTRYDIRNTNFTQFVQK
jgi:hypothetical protein